MKIVVPLIILRRLLFFGGVIEATAAPEEASRRLKKEPISIIYARAAEPRGPVVFDVIVEGREGIVDAGIRLVGG